MSDRGFCPCCGQPLPSKTIGARRLIETAAELLDMMRVGNRDVYRTTDGYWRLTHSQGDPHAVEPNVIRLLVENGTLRPTYSNTDDCLTLGRTIDVDATVARRKKERGVIVYAKESR